MLGTLPWEAHGHANKGGGRGRTHKAPQADAEPHDSGSQPIPTKQEAGRDIWAELSLPGVGSWQNVLPRSVNSHALEIPGLVHSGVCFHPSRWWPGTSKTLGETRNSAIFSCLTLVSTGANCGFACLHWGFYTQGQMTVKAFHAYAYGPGSWSQVITLQSQLPLKDMSRPRGWGKKTKKQKNLKA